MRRHRRCATSDRRAVVRVVNGAAEEVETHITLVRGQNTPIVDFDARGKCKLADGTDCRV